ncbi:MAG: cob(I)yrinic acid a,c-diamide adenosyltransferase, partial [Bacteroidales bacterium]|nr:cob(I)yrinic acid a,c-diamide adenosyltransferase [Bacteroidales bacterium]
TTSLIGGRRVRKDDAQVEVYGTLDELNSWLGLLMTYRKVLDDDDRRFIEQIQRNLFKIGGFYSFDFESGKDFSYPFVEETDVKALEEAIDRMDGRLPALTDFILPGGFRAAAQTHVARTVCRRCERLMVGFQGMLPEKERDRERLALRYVNRLSDYLFVLARYENFSAEELGL